jgi:citronellol/citronellal dehydrogenase
MSLRGKTLLITGATRGIGLAIALRAARDGARVALLGKTAEPHPRLPGTIFSAAEAVRAAGGEALALVADVRFEAQVAAAVARTLEAFGGLDILVNNASAIALTGTLDTELKQYDLMQQVNARGTFLCSRLCLPHLKRASNPHILNLAPPLELQPRWFARHTAYTMAKYGMSLCTLGLAAEFGPDGVAVNALWPLTVIDTSAVRNLLGGDPVARACRRPEIVADAARAILVRPARACTGRFFIDEEVLRDEGVSDFSGYAVEPGAPLLADAFLPDAVRAASPTPLVDRLPPATRPPQASRPPEA